MLFAALYDVPAIEKTPFGWLNYVVIILYLLGMLLLGAWFTRRQKTTADYFKAGGRVPWWAAGLSIYATMLSSITFVAIPAKSFDTNWTSFWVNVPILLIAPVIIHCFLPFYRQLGLTSAYEYLEKRFHRAHRLYGSASFIIFQVGRQSIVLYLPSLALAQLTDFNIYACILMMGALCVIYTVLGGMEAVVWTDVVQSILLLGAAVLSVVLILVECQGGFSNFWNVAREAGKMQMIDNSLNWGKDSTSFWVILFANIFVVLVPYTSDQSVVQRYMTTQDEQKAARAIWINALLCIPSTLIFLAIGTCLWFYFRLHPGQLDPSLPLDSVFPQFIVKVMPAGLAGLVIAGLFAAAQSTVSGSINSMATAFVTDIVKSRRPAITDRGALSLSRWLTGVFGVVATLGAIYIAYFNDQSIWDEYIALIGLGSSGLAGLFILGMVTRRAHAVGALVGVVASAVALAAVWWKCTNLQPHLYAAIGLVTCVAVGYTASLLIPFPVKDLAGLTIHTRLKKSEK